MAEHPENDFLEPPKISSEQCSFAKFITDIHNETSKCVELVKDDIETYMKKFPIENLDSIVKNGPIGSTTSELIMIQYLGTIGKACDSLRTLGCAFQDEYRKRFGINKSQRGIMIESSTESSLVIREDILGSQEEELNAQGREPRETTSDSIVNKETEDGCSVKETEPQNDTKEAHDFKQEPKALKLSSLEFQNDLSSNTVNEPSKNLLKNIKKEKEDMDKASDERDSKALEVNEPKTEKASGPVAIFNTGPVSEVSETADSPVVAKKDILPILATYDSLYNCPKLKMVVTVDVYKLNKSTVKILSKKGMLKPKQVKDVMQYFERLTSKLDNPSCLKYNPASTKNGAQKKRSRISDSDSSSTHSSCSLMDYDSNDENSIAENHIPISEDTGSALIPPSVASGDSNGSMMEITDSSESDENKKKKSRPLRSSSNEEKTKNRKKYFTPNVEPAENSIKKKRREKYFSSDSDDEKLELNTKKKMKMTEKSSGTSSANEEKKDEVSHSEGELSSYEAFLKKKKKGNKDSCSIKSEPEESSDFEPLTKKKFIHDSKAEKVESDGSCVPVSSDSDSSSSCGERKNASSKQKKTTNNCSEDSNGTKKKKRRRRIKKSSDASKSEDLDGDSDIEIIQVTKEEKKGKHIPKLLTKKDLQKETREAGKEEEERKKRVAENQKLYNEVFVSTEDPGSSIKELVLDFDKSTSKPLVSVDPEIVKHLKPHQVNGIKFLWDSCYESIATFSKNGKGGGCILAHCMGLGKTLQTIGFLHTVLSTKLCETKRALVICPLNTASNWYSEFVLWSKECEVSVPIHTLYDSKRGEARIQSLKDWERLGGVCIIHYDAFRNLVNSDEKKKGPKVSSRHLAIINRTLVDPGADVVVCDEGHLLKNDSSQLTKAVMKINTSRRIVLTGTPLQNNLLEYYTMVSFVKPNLLGTKHEFKNRFGQPISRGQHKDSEWWEVKLMKQRAHVLHKLLDGCVQRQDYAVLTPYLPPKFEYVISVNLSEAQKKLTDYYLKHVSAKSQAKKFQSVQLLADYQALVKIWAHPYLITISRNKTRMDHSETDSMDNFICDDSSDDSDSSVTELPIEKETQKTKRDGCNGENTDQASNAVEKDWYKRFLPENDDDIVKIELSGKMVVLFEILRICESIGDKVLVFSSFLGTLNVIERFLRELDQKGKQDEAVTFPPLDTSANRWRLNKEYFRIDGSTGTAEREKFCKLFNQKNNSKAKLFIISTKAGGLGINLTGANRVVIFDASWNPSVDIQSIFRVYRFGQTKPCYVYRLLARGTMEEKIYNRQVVKLSLSCRVVDEQQIERHFRFDEIEDLYKFNVDDDVERPIPIVPKDRLLGDMLISHEDLLFSYLEHDSLLENKQEEELTEEERKSAWEEYNSGHLNTGSQHNHPSSEWTSYVLALLRRTYPNLENLKILGMYKNICITHEEMFQTFVRYNSSTYQNDKDHFRSLMEQQAASLKRVFPDIYDWTVVHKSYGFTIPPSNTFSRQSVPLPSSSRYSSTQGNYQRLPLQLRPEQAHYSNVMPSNSLRQHLAERFSLSRNMPQMHPRMPPSLPTFNPFQQHPQPGPSRTNPNATSIEEFILPD